MSKIRRLRPTITRQPSLGAPEGLRAAFWRETVLKLSRPALADLLGVQSQVVERYENADKVPERYRLACAALGAGLKFDWDKPTAQVGATTIAF